METAHSVHVVKSIIIKRPLIAGQLHYLVCYDTASIPSVLLVAISLLTTMPDHVVGGWTHLNMKHLFCL